MDQNNQQPLRDFSTGMNIGLTTLFCINRTVQIWSRAPGTTGTWYFGFYFFFGSLMQAWYCEVNAIASMKLDWISPSALLGLSLVWFSVHGLTRAWNSIHGAQFHSYESGIGILAPLFPGWSGGSQACASDLCVSMAMSLVFWLFQSPILSGWYAAMCMWLLLGHLWVSARDARRRQSWIDSQTEAEIWSEQIQRRN